MKDKIKEIAQEVRGDKKIGGEREDEVNWLLIQTTLAEILTNYHFLR